MTRPVLRTALVGLALLASQARTSRADSITPPGSESTRTSVIVEDRWYGWQILAADVAVLTTVANLDEDNELGAPLFFGGLSLSGPLIHLAHGHHGRAAASAALRIGAPVAGAVLFGATCDESEHQDDFLGCAGNALIGFMLGAVTAETIDVIWARDTVVRELPFSPTVMATNQGASLGLAGTF